MSETKEHKLKGDVNVKYLGEREKLTLLERKAEVDVNTKSKIHKVILMWKLMGKEIKCQKLKVI